MSDDFCPVVTLCGYGYSPLILFSKGNHYSGEFMKCLDFLTRMKEAERGLLDPL